MRVCVRACEPASVWLHVCSGGRARERIGLHVPTGVRACICECVRGDVCACVSVSVLRPHVCRDRPGTLEGVRASGLNGSSSVRAVLLHSRAHASQTTPRAAKPHFTTYRPTNRYTGGSPSERMHAADIRKKTDRLRAHLGFGVRSPEKTPPSPTCIGPARTRSRGRLQGNALDQTAC